MTTWITDDNGNRCSVEKWIPVRGFTGAYEVSNLGRVRSIDRQNINRNGVIRLLKGRVFRPSLDGEGYRQVGLFKRGVETKVRVHRLVAEAFILNDRGLPLVDHRDRNRNNNTINNLRWASFSDNRRNTGCRGAPTDMRRMADLEAAQS